jgi:ubiquinol-cytochrome c reductase cytochrome c subunit
MAYVQANGGGPTLPSGDLRDGDLTPEEKRSIINYVQTIQDQADPGGAGIGRIGPVGEGLVIWVVGIGALLFGIFWMGSKA